MPLREYQVVGRRRPTETDKTPTIFRMRLFANNDVVAKSRFWYFLRQTHKLKRANGEILSVNEIFDKSPDRIKNFGISLKYYSRSGQHNIQKEYRDLTRTGAVHKMLMDMGGRHRTTYRRIQILEVKEIAAKDCLRASTKQFHDEGIKFPLPHRILRAPERRYRTTFKAKRSATHFG